MGYNNYNRGFEIDEEKAAEFLENAVEKILGAILYLTRSDIKGYEDANYILYQLAGKPMEWFPDGAMRHNLDIVEDILLLSAEVTEAFKDLD